jgi:hypothetical protein
MQATTRNRILAFSTAAVILLCQCLLTRDIREPAAEDATDLLAAALSDSWNPLRPMIDMFLLTGRLMALAAVSISLEWSPVLLSVFSIVLYSFITSYFCRPGFSWLVPDAKLRLLASVSFAVVSGTPEVVGSAVCAAYTLPVFAILLLLERPHAKGIILKWLFILLSTPLIFITFPLVVFFYAIRRERLYLWLFGLNIASLGISLVLRKILQHPASETGFQLDWQLFKAVEMLCGAMLASLVGTWAVLVMALPVPVLYAVGLALCILIWSVLRRADPEVAATGMGLLAIVPLYHAMHALGRSYGYDVLQLAVSLSWTSRNSFFTVIFPLMVWIIVLSKSTQVLSRRVQAACVALLIIANFTPLRSIANTAPVQGRGHWHKFQAWLDDARKPDALQGAATVLPVELSSGEVWAKLRCAREQQSIMCHVEQGNHHHDVYTLPVEQSTTP